MYMIRLFSKGNQFSTSFCMFFLGHIIVYIPIHIESAIFFANSEKPCRHITRRTPHSPPVKIRFQWGFQALVDMRSHKLAWIRIVHNAVLQPKLRWMPTAFKRAKPNWPPVLEEEISGHKSEKASLTKCIQWQRKRCTRVENPSSGNRKPRTQPYFCNKFNQKES